MFENKFFSPLSQFEILPIFSLNLGFADFSVTNSTLVMIILSFFLIILFVLMFETPKLKLLFNNWQIFFQLQYALIKGLVSDNINSNESSKFFPLVFCIFFFILCLNLVGLVPYSFTVTSHLIVTFAISVFIFIGLNIIAVKLQGTKIFLLFIPSGTSFALAFLLVPIELISYIFKPISLSIRLFANMMAGHTLLKVIAGFAYVLLGATGLLFLIHYVPLLLLIPLIGLELVVSLIQSFVFSILVCIYLNESVNLH